MVDNWEWGDMFSSRYKFCVNDKSSIYKLLKQNGDYIKESWIDTLNRLLFSMLIFKVINTKTLSHKPCDLPITLNSFNYIYHQTSFFPLFLTKGKHILLKQ